MGVPSGTMNNRQPDNLLQVPTEAINDGSSLNDVVEFFKLLIEIDREQRLLPANESQND